MPITLFEELKCRGVISAIVQCEFKYGYGVSQIVLFVKCHSQVVVDAGRTRDTLEDFVVALNCLG